MKEDGTKRIVYCTPSNTVLKCSDGSQPQNCRGGPPQPDADTIKKLAKEIAKVAEEKAAAAAKVAKEKAAAYAASPAGIAAAAAAKAKAKGADKDDDDDEEEEGVRWAPTIGGIVGGVALLILFFMVLFLFLKRGAVGSSTVIPIATVASGGAEIELMSKTPQPVEGQTLEAWLDCVHEGLSVAAPILWTMGVRNAMDLTALKVDNVHSISAEAIKEPYNVTVIAANKLADALLGVARISQSTRKIYDEVHQEQKQHRHSSGASASGSMLLPGGWPIKKKYSAFLSHYKIEAASDARYMKEVLERILKQPVFLDSDDLKDLRALVDEGVCRSDVVILLQTKGVLTRPWCLVELYAAVRAGIPIVAVNVSGAFPYDYQLAAEVLNTLASPTGKLCELNPGAHAVMTGKDGGVEDLMDMQKTLCELIPSLISKSFNPSATARQLNAQVEDIVESMLMASKSMDGIVMETTKETKTTTTTTNETRVFRAGTAEGGGGEEKESAI